MVNQITDRLHVSASARDVIREAWRAFNAETRADRSPKTRAARHRFYRECLSRHEENRDLYRRVMRGSAAL
jgi:hypothetical protein